VAGSLEVRAVLHARLAKIAASAPRRRAATASTRREDFGQAPVREAASRILSPFIISVDGEEVLALLRFEEVDEFAAHDIYTTLTAKEGRKLSMLCRR
jgi:hypothetical protein